MKKSLEDTLNKTFEKYVVNIKNCVQSDLQREIKNRFVSIVVGGTNKVDGVNMKMYLLVVYDDRTKYVASCNIYLDKKGVIVKPYSSSNSDVGLAQYVTDCVERV